MWNAALSKAIWSVLCVSLCLCVCVCVCLSLYSTLLFHFHTLRSFSSDAAASRAGTIRPAPCSLISLSAVGLIPSTFSILTSGGNEEAPFSSLAVTKIPLSTQCFPCQLQTSVLRFFLLFFLLVPFVWTWLTLASSCIFFFVACFARQAAGPFAFVPCFGQLALLIASDGRKNKKIKICVTDHSDMELLHGEEGKTQLLAPGLKCTSGRWKIKEILNLMNMH